MGSRQRLRRTASDRRRTGRQAPCSAAEAEQLVQRSSRATHRWPPALECRQRLGVRQLSLAHRRRPQPPPRGTVPLVRYAARYLSRQAFPLSVMPWFPPPSLDHQAGAAQHRWWTVDAALGTGWPRRPSPGRAAPGGRCRWPRPPAAASRRPERARRLVPGRLRGRAGQSAQPVAPLPAGSSRRSCPCDATGTPEPSCGHGAVSPRSGSEPRCRGPELWVLRP